MKKLGIVFVILTVFALSDSVLLVKKGWQLIGSSVPLATMSKFEKGTVEQVLHFDASTQAWLGYSPDEAVQEKMTQKGLKVLTSLENWHGFWVKSSKDWGLLLENTSLNAVPEHNNSHDSIQLKKGWNLISLPIDTVLSPKLFADLTVWKYNPQQQWELFTSTHNNENFPRIGHIKNADGLWVKAEKDQNISINQEASTLHSFENTQEMDAYITQMATLYQRPYCGIEPFFLENPQTMMLDDMVFAPVAMAESTSDATTSNTSSTNLQESEVDEADILKHDGTHIFYKVTQENKQSISITSFQALSENNNTALNHIYFSDERSLINMYLLKQNLIVLSSLYEINEEKYHSAKILVDIFDVSDITTITKRSSYKIDGVLSTSRMVGENLYLLSQFSPEIRIEYPKIKMSLSVACQNYFEGTNTAKDPSAYAECYGLRQDYEDNSYYSYDYENPKTTVTQLSPNIEGSSLAKQSLLTPQRFYAPLKQQQKTSISTLSHFDIAKATYTQSTSVIGNSSIQYASSKAFYLVSTEYPYYYDFNNYKERSSIYKLNLDSNLTYSAVGWVYGYALNQFALSEHNDILRIATTEGFSWGREGTNNSLYTLKSAEGLLTIQGVLSGLGKANETIKSVRFIGNKAYVVTFRQTDPFYTIDLSDPLLPKKAGELQVSGYSDYLHPIGEDKILGIGREADSQGVVQGIKIELFDVSDFANPSSLDSIVLPTQTYTRLGYDHKAFAYRNSDALFAFPYQQYANTLNNYNASAFLGVYQVKDNTLIDYQNIVNKGYAWGEERGLLFDMNGITYISFFANDGITTDTLKEK